jgi:anaphase-promoting complex subunit 5
MPGRTLLDVFLKRLWEINSFDALHHLFDSLGVLLAKGAEENEEEAEEEHPPELILLSKTSPLGAFVRRARLEFTRLQFDDAMKLWSAFITYRAPTAQWTKWIAGLASTGADSNISQMGLQPGDTLFEIAYGHLADDGNDRQALSRDDIEQLLEFQLDQLQRMFISAMLVSY